ncbi:maleylpyruvate isomerase N-terminal domain-containing protein [Georgenia ruanii]|uniref:Maleylpyruvate isomerase family mycothiol-dependent enzyme n=1 Tax=Georgenia ruanii TaxID=348442 RepID=A0A7J9USA9_9MICO|nr:maleylpyruvate isomerase N-terminal domain-containing protein [Georgenia ruanii]MPV87233.1 maleylpyruvate isomerase family mycothiol-dependent enzyme [Georgenia ruanii]
MTLETTARVLRAEAAAMVAALRRVPDAEWSRPTRCAPWDVRGLLGHVHVVLGWLPPMLDDAAPPSPAVTAAGYYRPDGRFDPSTNARRVALGRDQAGEHRSPAQQLAAFDAHVVAVVARCLREPPDRVVRTRHGDAMLLADFLTTRVLEVAVHGLDLADALAAQPWLTAAAASHLRPLWLDDPTVPAALGWDGAQMLRKVTGRAGLEPAEAVALEAAGVRSLALG